MFTARDLKNIDLQVIREFLKNNNVSIKQIEDTTNDTTLKFPKYVDLIEKEMADINSQLNEEIVDEFLFEQLYYSHHNCQYIYSLENYFHQGDLGKEEIIAYLENNQELNFDQKLTDWSDNNDVINLCTTRVEFDENDNFLALHLLLRFAILDQQYGRTNAFCAVRIDFEFKLVSLKFHKLQMQRHELSPTLIVDLISSALKNLGDNAVPFACLNLNFQHLNEADVLSTIYKLFAELSKEAQEILDEQMDDDTEDKILDFLQNMNLRNINQDYIEQIKAVIYQDISRNIDQNNFKKGWVFKFSFREGDHSRAASNAERRQPVYELKAFWQLKELIHDIEEMEDGGFHWNLNNINSVDGFIDVRVESKNGTMIIHYYAQNKKNRKEKENYVLRKITEYLQE